MPDQNRDINREALFCDETMDYRTPAEPEEGQTVTLRFRTARQDTDCIYYVEKNSGLEREMVRVSGDSLFDYFACRISVGTQPVDYYFKIVKESSACYYCRLGALDRAPSDGLFRITPGFHTPDWAKGAVMYQIYVDRFCNGDSDNDVVDNEYYYIDQPVKQVKDWGRMPSAMDVGYFYGGDLQGVMNKLDYLEKLGVEVIYLNPIFVSPSNHKYDCQDYEHIDPHYGVIVRDGGEPLGEEDKNNEHATKYQIRSAHRENLEASDRFFVKFVQEVHRRGMKVVLDGVFNHCGSFNKWLDGERIYEQAGEYEPGAYISEDSPYHGFFKFYEDGTWPYNDKYDGWWGHSTLPKLNYEESEKLYEYILNIARKWVSPPYCVDGWRLDVAADLGHSAEFNHKFWRDFRKAVKEANPDALILAEHYGDPSDWLQGDQWDTVMNYDAFMEPVTWFLTGMEKHSDEYREDLYGNGESFFNSMRYHMSRLQTPCLQTAMNELSNHDHSRFLTRTNRTIGRLAVSGTEAAEEGINYGILRQAVMIQMTWPGAPTVYYGDETGVCGWTDPDSRRTYPWKHEDYELIEYHDYMIRYHKRFPALRRGSVLELKAGRHLIAYGRMYQDSRCVIVVNSQQESRTVEVPVWKLGIPDGAALIRRILTVESGYNAGSLLYEVDAGRLELEMPPVSSILLTIDLSENRP